MSAGSAGSAPKRRIDRWLRREQRDHRAGGIASRRDLGLSFIHSARMGRAYGKCRLNTLRLSADDVFTETAYSVPFAHPDLELPDGNGAVERSPVYVQFINANSIGTSQAIAEPLEGRNCHRCPHRADFL